MMSDSDAVIAEPALAPEERGMTDGDVETPLTELEARARAGKVSSVNYAIRLHLGTGETYLGSAVVTFNFNGAAADAGDGVFLDFTGKKIVSLSVNGAQVGPSDTRVGWRGQRILLHRAVLADGANAVAIDYVSAYDHTGAGLHKFVDPEDGNTYLYTNFEPFDAHRAAPCFDQPDIKGIWSLTLDVPKGWVALGNGRAASRVLLPDGATERVTFDATAPLSSYLFAVIAGPFYAVTTVMDGLPLGLYCRQKLAQYLDSDVLFTVTKQGLKWYADFFGIAYPFSKYDQIFAPEFNQGAMENAGAVTFTEHYLFRDPPTESQLSGRADTVLHEMAHMWFGDLVTMKWWDGLWLNESFATYMAALCVAEATVYGEASWVQFANRMKAWAYREDQMRTTHSIQPESVADTDTVFLNFDGVTYGKGASVLKQLVAVVGRDTFRAAMRAYMARHKWGNTSLSDFLSAIQAAAKDRVDMEAWSQQWLCSPGLNTLKPTITTHGGGMTVTGLEISQTAHPSWPTLRKHCLEVSFHDHLGRVLAVLPVTVQAAASTHVELPAGGLQLLGTSPLAYVNINHNDHAFAKVSLDPVTLAFAKSGLTPHVCSSPLNRQILWGSLWDMTRDAALPASAFLDIAAAALPAETDTELALSILRRCQGAIFRFLPSNLVDATADRFFILCRALALDHGANAGRKTIFTRSMVSFAGTATAAATLAGLLDAPESEPVLDQGTRWSALHVTAALSVEGFADRLARELARDGSDRGQRGAIAARVAVADSGVKAAAWADFLNPDSKVSLHDAGAAMGGFWQRSQLSMLASYEDAFFREVVGIFAKRPKQFAQQFFGSLCPPCDDHGRVLGKLAALRSSLSDGQADQILRRMVDEEIDDYERVLRCKALPQA